MPDKPIANDPSKPLEVRVQCGTPHVVAYRLWHRQPPSTEWREFAAGHTSDEKEDHHSTGPLPDGTRVSYFLLIGGPPGTDFEVEVSFEQDGREIPGGRCPESGSLAQGAAVRKLTLVLT